MSALILPAWLLFPLMVPALSWDPSAPFPSCLVEGISWDPSNVLDLVTVIESPESCQSACSSVEDCVAFSWLTEDSGLIAAHSCVLFSETGEDLPFENVISGPRECSCYVTGECKTVDGNIIEVIADTTNVDECNNLCAAESECVAFTFMGEEHPLANLCFLFSSCLELDDECVECTTGVAACQTCNFEATIDGACAVCGSKATTISYAPALPGLSSRMMLCDDPLDQTCEKDLGTLCSTGFHLCSHLEFNVLNEKWDVSVPKNQSPVGEIYCKLNGGAGHFSLAHASNAPITLNVDEASNCAIGSSRPQCQTSYGCADKLITALCCSDNPDCGNGVVEDPLEECDDGNTSDDDDCLSSCTWRVPNEHGSSEHC